ncbi:unnamed protein product [Clonostachys solani]|uniref:Major facilitator superfamily (MFS) profile domain-containing protein n=1 Tax=Clonostachys solani TaxID=160281 RepID=A0A9N9Z252_9HYPO|nr:unnamed protein product [Clonostachys solani]
MTPSATASTPLLSSWAQNEEHSASGTVGNDDDERTVIQVDLPFAKKAAIMCLAWFGIFLGSVDSTIIATLSGPIASEFGSLNQLSWLATAYLIANAACQPLSGRITDIFGRGPGIAVSHAFFALGNLMCGLAPNQYVMILGRVVAGLGGGGLVTIAIFLISDLFPLRQRGMVSAIGNLWFGAGLVLGGLIGGLLNDYTKLGWRLAFLIQVPPGLLSAVAVLLMIKVPPKESKKSRMARIDFFGVLLTCSSLVLLLYGFSNAGTVFPWTHPVTLTTIPLAVVLLIGFFFWEARTPQPIIPVRLLLDPTVLASCLTSLLTVMIFMTSLFYVPLYLQVLGDSATTAGVKLLSSSLAVPIGSFGAGFLMTRTGKYIGLAYTSILAFTFGVSLFSLQSSNSPAWLTCLALFFVGGGYNATVTTTQVASVAAVDHSQQAAVTSAVFMARSIGSTLGLAIASAAYQNTLRRGLSERFGNESNARRVIDLIMNDLNELKRLPRGWYEGTLASFMEAFRAVWFILLGMAILNFICLLPIRQHKLHPTVDRN